MRVSDEIRIIDLLTQREAEFLRVKQCEDQITALLGGAAWPFSAPAVPLPSANRTNAKKAWTPAPSAPTSSPAGRRAKSATVAPAAPVNASRIPVRELEPARENAYLVTYIDNGANKSGFLNTLPTLQALLKLECASFQITGIDTVVFRSNDDFDTVERLYEKLQ